MLGGAVELTFKVKEKIFPMVPSGVAPPRMLSAKETKPGPSSDPQRLLTPFAP